MGKVIFAVLTAFIAWVLFKGLSKTSKRTDIESRDDVSPRPTENQASLPERMVKCATCGVFMPESESTTNDGVVSCRDPQLCVHRKHS